MRISDWSSDVCSSDLIPAFVDYSAPKLLWPFFSQMVEAQRYLCVDANACRFRHNHPNITRPHTHFRFSNHPATKSQQIGRASCRERVCQYVTISLIAVALTKKRSNTYTYR